MRQVGLLREPPADLCRGIGRIIAAYAYLEHQLQQIVYSLTGVGQKEGRLSIREPRAKERAELIRELLGIHDINITVPNSLINDLRDLTTERDQLAHGVWTHLPSGYAFVTTSGSWDATQRGKKATKKKVRPAGVVTDSDALRNLRAEIDRVTDDVMQLRAEVRDALATSPRTPR